MLPCAPDTAALRALFVRNFRFVLAGDDAGGVSAENLRFLFLLVPLPVSWGAWDAVSQAACSREVYEATNRRRWRCRLLGPDGLCLDYRNRPYICRNFSPNEKECAACSHFGSLCQLVPPVPSSPDAEAPSHA